MEVSEPGADGEDVKNTAQLGGGSFGCGSLGGVGVSGVGCSDGRALGELQGRRVARKEVVMGGVVTGVETLAMDAVARQGAMLLPQPSGRPT